jgi:uncharacterized membrane protein YraQ (UPF0718 family)
MPHMQTALEILAATWEMTLAAAPWLMVGLVVAALIKVYVPSQWLTRFLHGRGGVIKAAFIGAPLPLCSCGVIPAALALRRQGASRGAVMSFLVATPETGVDSVAVSYALLGPYLAIVRPIAAISSAIATGLVGAAIPETAPAGTCCESNQPKPTASCCGTNEPAPTSSCCSSDEDIAATLKPGLFAALIDAATEVLGDTMKWLVIGLLMAGIISVFITPEYLEGWGSGLPVMILMVLVGIPMYICATASTPLAAGLLLAGLSPGAVLVFMMAGPATNVATLGVVRKEMGTRHMVAYLATVSVSAILCGLATDAIASAFSVSAIAQAQASHHREMIPQWLAILSLAVLVVLAVKPLCQSLVRSSRIKTSGDGSSSTNTQPAIDDRP